MRQSSQATRASFSESGSRLPPGIVSCDDRAAQQACLLPSSPVQSTKASEDVSSAAMPLMSMLPGCGYHVTNGHLFEVMTQPQRNSLPADLGEAPGSAETETGGLRARRMIQLQTSGESTVLSADQNSIHMRPDLLIPQTSSHIEPRQDVCNGVFIPTVAVASAPLGRSTSTTLSAPTPTAAAATAASLSRDTHAAAAASSMADPVDYQMLSFPSASMTSACLHAYAGTLQEGGKSPATLTTTATNTALVSLLSGLPGGARGGGAVAEGLSAAAHLESESSMAETIPTTFCPGSMMRGGSEWCVHAPSANPYWFCDDAHKADDEQAQSYNFAPKSAASNSVSRYSYKMSSVTSQDAFLTFKRGMILGSMDLAMQAPKRMTLGSSSCLGSPRALTGTSLSPWMASPWGASGLHRAHLSKTMHSPDEGDADEAGTSNDRGLAEAKWKRTTRTAGDRVDDGYENATTLTRDDPDAEGNDTFLATVASGSLPSEATAKTERTGSGQGSGTSLSATSYPHPQMKRRQQQQPHGHHHCHYHSQSVTVTTAATTVAATSGCEECVTGGEGLTLMVVEPPATAEHGASTLESTSGLHEREQQQDIRHPGGQQTARTVTTEVRLGATQRGVFLRPVCTSVHHSARAHAWSSFTVPQLDPSTESPSLTHENSSNGVAYYAAALISRAADAGADEPATPEDGHHSFTQHTIQGFSMPSGGTATESASHVASHMFPPSCEGYVGNSVSFMLSDLEGRELSPMLLRSVRSGLISVGVREAGGSTVSSVRQNPWSASGVLSPGTSIPDIRFPSPTQAALTAVASTQVESQLPEAEKAKAEEEEGTNAAQASPAQVSHATPAMIPDTAQEGKQEAGVGAARCSLSLAIPSCRHCTVPCGDSLSATAGTRTPVLVTTSSSCSSMEATVKQPHVARLLLQMPVPAFPFRESDSRKSISQMFSYSESLIPNEATSLPSFSDPVPSLGTTAAAGSAAADGDGDADTGDGDAMEDSAERSQVSLASSSAVSSTWTAVTTTTTATTTTAASSEVLTDASAGFAPFHVHQRCTARWQRSSHLFPQQPQAGSSTRLVGTGQRPSTTDCTRKARAARAGAMEESDLYGGLHLLTLASRPRHDKPRWSTTYMAQVKVPAFRRPMDIDTLLDVAEMRMAAIPTQVVPALGSRQLMGAHTSSSLGLLRTSELVASVLPIPAIRDMESVASLTSLGQLSGSLMRSSEDKHEGSE